MFYDSVQTVTNNRGIWPESPRYCDDFTSMCNNLFGNTAGMLRFSHELVKSTPNTCPNRARINRNSLQFLKTRGIFSHNALYMLPGHLFRNESSLYNSCSIDPTI